jgi:hypothetical protein
MLQGNGAFSKGHIPWNKGMKGIRVSPDTEFKKGVVSWNRGKKYHTGIKTLGFTGKKHSEETKLKMSLAAKSHVFTTEHRDNISKALKGHKMPDSHKVAMSKRLKGNKYRQGIPHSEETKKIMSDQRQGELNGNWKGGLSFLPYSSEFNYRTKESIRERDNRQCQKCGILETEHPIKLAIHHVDYNKQKCCSNNLITLCKKCNSEVNGNRDYWKSFFVEKLQDIKSALADANIAVVDSVAMSERAIK